MEKFFIASVLIFFSFNTVTCSHCFSAFLAEEFKVLREKGTERPGETSNSVEIVNVRCYFSIQASSTHSTPRKDTLHVKPVGSRYIRQQLSFRQDAAGRRLISVTKVTLDM